MDKGSVVFAKAETADGVPLIILGIHPDAVEYMKDGKTNNFDLTMIGIPVRIMMFGASSQAAALAMVEQAMKAARPERPFVDATKMDFAIDPSTIKKK